jgi:hypothetical protein
MKLCNVMMLQSVCDDNSHQCHQLDHERTSTGPDRRGGSVCAGQSRFDTGECLPHLPVQ